MLSPFLEKTLRLIKALQLYHRHEVFGLENVPPQGAVLLISNHSLATYDVMLLYGAIYESIGRVGKGLGDRMIFKTPMLNTLATKAGISVGSHENAKRLIENGELIGIAPGGMLESLRTSQDKYKIYWERRKGFVKLAVTTGTPIVLSACPKADDIFTVYPSPLTQTVYQKFRFPLPVFRGLGMTALPRPAKLIHCLSEPLKPPAVSDEQDLEKSVDQFHSQIIERMNLLMAEALEKG